MKAATKDAFEMMAQLGSGDAGALALGLRRGVTAVGLRALAAKTLHVAAAAPERMADIYDNASAGWLAGPVFPPRLRTEEPLPISQGFWNAFWELVNLPADRSNETSQLLLGLAGRLDPRISRRMAGVASELPGVAEAASGEIPDPIDLEMLANCPPASLGFQLREELSRNGGGLGEPFGRGLVALLRHMPPPLDYINIQVIQTLPVMALVAGYSRAGLDQAGIGGFLMAQVAHHYSALSTAVTLTSMGRRPRSLELTLDSIFKGWVHGKATPQLIGVPWHELWDLRLDQVREALGVTPYDSPYAAAVRKLSADASKH